MVIHWRGASECLSYSFLGQDISPGTLRDAFAKEKWDQPVVILIDELGEIFRAAPGIKDSFLRTLRGIRHKSHESAVTSVIAAGTFSIMRLTTTDSSLSPFNISSSVQTPYLAYNTFRGLVTSLRAERVREAVQLYRTRFAGFLEDVNISGSDEVLADFLTAEGVLSRPVAEEPKYRVIPPLIDALVTLQVIPNQLPLAPSISVPIVFII